MKDDTENLLWAMRDIRAGALPRPARFSHNGKTYCATFRKRCAETSMTLKNVRTKTERTYVLRSKDFAWAEDMVEHVLKAYLDE